LADEKMNVIGGMFKDETNWGNCPKAICVCYWKLCTCSKFWNSQQYECKECNSKTIENNKGKGSAKE
jgi:hypothetical protein